MDIIKNYLENMFASLPGTAEVKRAKRELGQMMEDKYNELISEGKTENEAVGTVISEFGNLSDLAEDLGLEKEVEEDKRAQEEMPRRKVSLEEVREYLSVKKQKAFLLAVGVMLCILSVVPVIFFGDCVRDFDFVGIILMILCVGAAIVLFVQYSARGKKFDFLRRELCSIDYATATEVKNEYENYENTHAVRLTIGILLAVFCWLPAALEDEIRPMFGFSGAMEGICSCLLFVLASVGVFLIVLTNNIKEGYETILDVNDRNTVGGEFSKPEGEIVYINDTVDTLMRVYWPTVTCLYLCWSFLTFAWWRTWIIWPIAAIIHAILKKNLRK